MELTLTDALELVLDLASQNTLDPMDCDDMLVATAWRQDEALNVITAYLDELKREK